MVLVEEGASLLRRDYQVNIIIAKCSTLASLKCSGLPMNYECAYREITFMTKQSKVPTRNSKHT